MSTNYEKDPVIKIKYCQSPQFFGWNDIFNHCKSLTKGKSSAIIAIETYQGVNEKVFKDSLYAEFSSYRILHTTSLFKDEKEIEKMVFPFVTNDRVFGSMNSLSILDFFSPVRLKELQKNNFDNEDKCIIYGPGASLITSFDLLVYMDMPRWEIQQRMREGLVNNLGLNNRKQDPALLYKQSYFVDWRVLDEHKFNIYANIDLYIDSTEENEPKMIDNRSIIQALKQVVNQPFRLKPFFDPGVWGGQWLKNIMDLDKKKINYAWGFDCVPEENSILLEFEDTVFEIPAINLVKLQTENLLGRYVMDKFGAEFPIRFDFLDTMQGQNLSLQVHPDKNYIYEKFKMPYTQDESYYIMDTGDDAQVYLGVKEEVSAQEIIENLKNAQENKQSFDANKYIARFPVKKHDHILIPSGTIHCSGKNTVVLEISATPYIFTFKLWDWGRLGMDDRPRPINIEHGENVIRWERDEKWVRKNLVNNIQVLDTDSSSTEERTGLFHENFIETRRHWFSSKIIHNTESGVNVLNLVEGKEVLIESPEGYFEPFTVHYAETFIIPACIGNYSIKPHGVSAGEKCATIKAFIRK